LLDFLAVFLGEFFLVVLAGLFVGEIFLGFLEDLFIAAWFVTPDAGAIGVFPGIVLEGVGKGLLSNGYKMSTAPAVTAVVEKGDPTDAWA
jgi:hypothetical protein